MERQAFEKLVAEGFDAIPEKFRARIKNVVLMVEDEPSAEVRKQEGLGANETLLGLYTGWPLSERGDHYGVGTTMPDTILIFQKPIEAAAGANQERLREIVAQTVWHEIAHHFGFNEAEVRVRERLHRRGQKK